MLSSTPGEVPSDNEHPATSDIRSLVKTINSLPKHYQGKCDILINHTDSVVVTRNLLILYVLLSPGPSIDEAAELATHLMYSSRLSPASAAYLRRAVQDIYGDGPTDGDMSFQSFMKTRGRGKLFSVQPTAGIKRPIEMLLSRYELPKAMRRMRDVLFDPFRVDDRHQMLSGLKPVHRMALNQFWKTGVLAPFSMDVSPFTEPNRYVDVSGP
jgi:hypothetical protein